MLELQKFIKNNPIGWPTLLRNDPYNLMVKGNNGLLVFKYILHASDFNEPLVIESRGIILEETTHDVVCLPFDKFFNYGETEAYDINLANSYVLEKVDGSLIKLYYHNGWKVATSGTVDANDADTSVDSISFLDIFFGIINKSEFELLTEKLNKDNTYLFEMVHPLIRIVVNYPEGGLTLLGCRNNKTLEDYDIFSLGAELISHFSDYGIRLPKKYDITVADLSELSKIADELNVDGFTFEGFIVSEVVDGKVNGRVKIKSPKYLLRHHIANMIPVKGKILNVFLDGETSEFDAHIDGLSEYFQDEYNSLKQAFYTVLDELNIIFPIYKNKMNTEYVDDKKSLALDIHNNVDSRLISHVLSHVNYNITPIDSLRRLPIKKLKTLVDSYRKTEL